MAAGVTTEIRVKRGTAAGSRAVTLLTLAGVLGLAGAARADGKERTLVFGEGAAAEVELKGRSSHGGLNAFVEWNAIDEWLELELGASILATDGGVVVPVDLLLKKPFTITHSLELMVGFGPEMVQFAAPGDQATVWGVEGALDLMLWPTQHYGLWVEPSYDLLFRDRVEGGMGGTAGVMLGF